MTFDGTSPNGTWSLYVVDDCQGGWSNATIDNGWSLDITTNAPTAVEITGFSARVLAGRVQLRWRSASETEIAGYIAGYNVYRASAGRTLKVNRALIAARHAGTAAGASYRLLDGAAGPALSATYRLEVVRTNGTRSSIALAATGA